MPPASDDVMANLSMHAQLLQKHERQLRELYQWQTKVVKWQSRHAPGRPIWLGEEQEGVENQTSSDGPVFAQV